LEQEANVGRKPEAVSADAGYWSEDNVSDGQPAGVDLKCRDSGAEQLLGSETAFILIVSGSR